MSGENWDLEAGYGFQPNLERVGIPPTIINLDSPDNQDFSEINDIAEDIQYEAPVSSHLTNNEPNDSGYKAKRLSPQRSGSPIKESSKSDHQVKKDESMGRGRDDVDRRRGRSDQWGSSSDTNEERRDTDGFSHRDCRKKPSSHGSPKETNSRDQVPTRESGMSRDSESRGRREMWGSAFTSSERKGAERWPGRSSNSPPPPDMDDRRHRISRSISPRGDRGRLRRNRSRSRSRTRSRSRSHSPYGSRRGDRRPPAGQVCRDFMAGRCRRGQHCRFSHQDSTGHNQYSSPLDYQRNREKDRDRERERDRDQEREIGKDRERYPTRDDKDNLYDSRGQTEYSCVQSSHGYKNNYDEPSYNSKFSNSIRSSERCFDFSMGRCTRGANCRYVHHEASSGRGGWDMRSERETGWDERERDGSSRSRVSNLDDGKNDISLESERDKRSKGKETCKFFLEGRCGRGQSCRFSHEVGNEVHGEDVNEWSWSDKMRDDMHIVAGTHSAYVAQPQEPNLPFTGQVVVPQQPLQSFYPVTQNHVNPNPVNQNQVNPNPIGGTTGIVLGSELRQPTVNSYTSVSSNPSHTVPGYNLQGQTVVVPTNVTQSIQGPNPDRSFPQAPPPPVNQPNPNPSNMLTSEQAANINVEAYLSQILANNSGESTSIPFIPAPAPAQPGNNPAPHDSPVNPPIEINSQVVKKEEDVLGQKQRMTSNPNLKLSKETKGVKLFKCTLVEVVKDLLKPSWKDGQLSREAHKTIVKKVVDKVTGTMEGGTIPQTREKIDSYFSHSKSKLTKLVQAYVEKYVKPVDN